MYIKKENTCVGGKKKLKKFKTLIKVEEKKRENSSGKLLKLFLMTVSFLTLKVITDNKRVPSASESDVRRNPLLVVNSNS